MAGGRLSPRQKMINLMYLIFIAMLALNIDREVLRAFNGINTTLQDTSVLAGKNNELFYANLDAKVKKDPGFQPVYQQAEEVKKKSDEFYSYVEGLKKSLMTASGAGTNGEEFDYKKMESNEYLNKMFFPGGKTTDKAKEYQTKVQAYKDFMLTNAKDDTDKARLEKLFSTVPEKGSHGHGDGSWIQTKFLDQPMVASLTQFSKTETDIRNEESNVITKMLSSKLDADITLKAFKPIIAGGKVFLPNEDAAADVFFGAYDNSVKGSMSVGGSSLPLKDGKGSFKINTSGAAGPRSVSGSMTFIDGKGVSHTEPFTYAYEIASNIIKDIPKGGVITAEKMNVVYRGISNPMGASVNGVDPGSITLSATNGSLSKSGPKEWAFNPGGGDVCSFTVSGKTKDGTNVTEKKDFRVKRIPNPQGTIREKNIISMPASSIANQTVAASIPGFEFPIDVIVTGFKLKVPGEPTLVVSGPTLASATSLLSRVRKGDQVTIFDITCTSQAFKGMFGSVSPVIINVQ